MMPVHDLGTCESHARLLYAGTSKSGPVSNQYTQQGSDKGMCNVQFPIVDPQMHIRQGYPAYDSGIQQDVFVKDCTDKPYVGQARH